MDHIYSLVARHGVGSTVVSKQLRRASPTEAWLEAPKEALDIPRLTATWPRSPAPHKMHMDMDEEKGGAVQRTAMAMRLSCSSSASRP